MGGTPDGLAGVTVTVPGGLFPPTDGDCSVAAVDNVETELPDDGGGGDPALGVPGAGPVGLLMEAVTVSGPGDEFGSGVKTLG